MKPLTNADCAQFDALLAQGVSMQDALATSVGGALISDGVWRIFSGEYPTGGVSQWNSSWKTAWGLPINGVHAFGEDLFGNQLLICSNRENAFLWNHENGELVDLLLDPHSLLQTVLQSGLDWIEFYEDGSLTVAKLRLPDVPLEFHLHWTTPLVFNGRVSLENTAVLERSKHLVAHAELWGQIKGLQPGTVIIPRKSKDNAV